MSRQQRITVLGSTGSIGVSTLDVVARHPERFQVYALASRSRVAPLLDQCVAFEPTYAVMLDADAATELEAGIRQAGLATRVLCGVDALETVAATPETDVVMAAIVGAAGLRPALAAARAGKRILLANKETLVMAGHVFMEAVEQGGATLLPIDSEHNAIFQVLPQRFARHLADYGIRRILLTASGGPFRNWEAKALQRVTPEAALNHPNWSMGPKITVDSSTLMNKGLEVIEAHWLFGAAPEEIEVVIHPQSVVHSMVEYVDGSVLAQLGNPDMRTPIAYALGYPERMESGVAALDLFQVARLDFEAPDTGRFPCLALAFEALRRGGTAATLLNAANEVAVQAFLARQLSFMDIPRLIQATLEQIPTVAADTLEVVESADREARAVAQDWLLART